MCIFIVRCLIPFYGKTIVKYKVNKLYSDGEEETIKDWCCFFLSFHSFFPNEIHSILLIASFLFTKWLSTCRHRYWRCYFSFFVSISSSSYLLTWWVNYWELYNGNWGLNVHHLVQIKIYWYIIHDLLTYVRNRE